MRPVRPSTREELLAEIDAEAAATAPMTGRPALAARVRTALERVPREAFVPGAWRDMAWEKPAATHRPRPDHLPALHRCHHDRAPGSRRWRPDPRDRHRMRLSDGGAGGAMLPGLHGRAHPRADAGGAGDPGRARLCQHRISRRRRAPGLAGSRALRRHHRHRRRGAAAGGPGRAAQARRAHGRAGFPAASDGSGRACCE